MKERGDPCPLKDSCPTKPDVEIIDKWKQTTSKIVNNCQFMSGSELSNPEQKQLLSVTPFPII